MDELDPAYAARQALIAYWLAYPRASDTLEGIGQWWVCDPTLTSGALEAALRWLIERGVVIAHEAADGCVRYCLSDPDSGTGAQ